MRRLPIPWPSPATGIEERPSFDEPCGRWWRHTAFGRTPVRPSGRCGPHEGMRRAAAALLLASVFGLAFPVAAANLAGDPDRGEQLYQACTDCHSLDKNDVGPRHRGVFGRKAGSLPDYSYSDALRILQYRLERGDARQVADRSAGLRARRPDVLPSRQPAGPRRRHRLSQGAGEIGCASPSVSAGRGARPAPGDRVQGTPPQAPDRSLARPPAMPDANS